MAVFAYADPPYPGQSARWYRDHPDYAGEVDHAELIDRLVRDYPDGWALSTSATALREVLPLCPDDARIAVWHIKNSETPGNRGRWKRSWEPVIVRGGRTRYGDGPTVCDVLSCGVPKGVLTSAGHFPGSKPPAFTRWLFMLLGAQPQDELHDLFPGSGAVARAWESYQRQPVLVEELPEKRAFRIPRELKRAGVPGLWTELLA